MEVLTTEGYKSIADINVGDKVIGLNNQENTLLEKRSFTKEWFDEQGVDEWKWYLINGTHKLFRNQNIFVKQGDFNICHAFELKVGWIISDINGDDLEITSIEETTPNEEWWSVELSGDHSFISDGLTLHNASRYWVGGGSSVNWNATGNTNWSATSGGANNASVPSSTDDVTFDGAGGGNSASTISATITILSLTITSGYTNTMTHNAIVVVAGNWSRAGTYTVAGSSGVTISAASTITSNGLTWANNLTFNGANTTKALVGSLVVTGLFVTANSTQTINKTTSETLTLNGGFTAVSVAGTCDIILGGGTWTGTSGTTLTNNLSIAGNVTLSGANLQFGTGTLTYTSGTVTTTGSTLNINSSCTLNTAGIVFDNINVKSASTITNNSLLTATGTFTRAAQAKVTFAGSYGFIVGTLSDLSIQNSANQSDFILANGVTYTITTALNSYLSRNGSVSLFTSDDGTLTANLILSQGATCNTNAFFTRIDANGGRPINTWNGTITSCTNVNQFTDLRTVGF